MQTMERNGPSLEDANASLRNAVEARLAGTAQDEAVERFDALQSQEMSDDELQKLIDNRRTGGTIAERTLQEALEAVRDRHGKYGPPHEHFSRTAALVNAAFGTNFTGTDWALVMVLDKVARLRGPTPTTDGGVDIAGYGGCYEECRRRGA